MIQAIEMYTQAGGQDTEESNKTAQEIWKIIVDNVFSIGTVGVSPAVMGIRVVKNTLGNIPARQVNMQHAHAAELAPGDILLPRVTGSRGDGVTGKTLSPSP